MTTQVPYQQNQYPTTPPWATTPPPAAPDPAPPAPGAVTPWDVPYPQHGQLLVPYPEEMQNAARAAPPAWWPVIVWTLFAGVFGLVSASRRANQARRGRNSPAPYWIAWAVTAAVVSVAGAAGAAVAVPAYLAYREDTATRLVQQNILHDGQLEASARFTATTANCEPVGPRDAAGMRRYDCLVALDDGRAGTMEVIADRNGDWTAVTTTR